MLCKIIGIFAYLHLNAYIFIHGLSFYYMKAKLGMAIQNAQE